MVKHLLRVNYICLAMVLSLISISYQSVWADGSKDMYPSDYFTRYGVTTGSAGDYRACLLSGITSSGSDPDLAAPYPTFGTIKVYAKAGEHIYVASSAMIVKSTISRSTYGSIEWRAPNGKSGKVSNLRNGGLISNRTQELAGPNINGSTKGYDAYKITVGADQEGVWEIDFIGATTTLNFATETPNNHRINSWKEDTNLPYINAFDVSVSNTADNAFIPGRVYANVLNLLMPSNFGGTSYSCEWYTTLYVLTNTGYLYEVKPNGQNGHFSTFFANNKGVQTNPEGWITDNSDFSTSKSLCCYGGFPAYASLTSDLSGNSFRNNRVPTYDPRRPDRKSTRMVDGEEKVTDDITHKIFFTKPAVDLPAFARAVYGKKVEETWLLSDLNSKDTPTLSNLSLVGKESNQKGVLGPEGVNIFFEANVGGDFQLEMNFGAGFTNRVLSGVCVKGENVIEWDGKDGAGKSVPVVDVVLAGKLKAAEIHFPFFDLENNKHGLILNQLKADWSAVERDTIYWDDTKLGVSKGSSEDALDMTKGTNSPAHKWYEKQSNRGDKRIIDTWTYAQGASGEEQHLTAVSRYIDLAIKSISCDVNTTHVGDTVTYTLEIENRALGEATFEGQPVTVDADADSASFGVWFATGGFYTTAVELVSSDDPTCEVKSQPSGEEFGLGFISLKNGKGATVRVRGYAGAELAHTKVQPKGFIMRPGDYFEIDANNLAADGMPLNPAHEYEGKDHNNLLLVSTPLFVLNSAPKSSADEVVVAAGQTLTGNLLENDVDVDRDHLSITSYTIGGVDAELATETPIYNNASLLCGSFTLKADGSYTFVANGDFSGQVPEILCQVSDRYEGSAMITVADLIPGTGESRLSIQVLPNHDPVVAPTEVLIHRTSDKTLLPLSITDEDDDDLTITLEGDDKELFTVEGDSVYYIGASVSSLTTYHINIVVNDGVKSPVNVPVTVKVSQNHVPDLTPKEITIRVKQNSAVRYLLPVRIFDEDGDKITNISLSGSGDFLVEDDCFYFNATTGNTNANKSYNLKVVLTDELGGVSSPINLKVNVVVSKSDILPSNAYVTAEDIYYGAPLSSAFDRAADVEGEWLMKRSSSVYYEDDAILPVGSYNFDLLFAPNSSNYLTEEVKNITFNVLPRAITLQSDSATKVYDGEALTAPQVKVVEGSLVGADKLIYAEFSSLINADTVVNGYTYSAAAGTSLANYEVTVKYGALMVTPAPITITSESDTKEYDGDPLTKEVVSVTEGSLKGTDEFVYTNFASQTDAGTTDNRFDVAAASGTLLSNYQISKQYGTLSVTKKVIEGYGITLNPSSVKYNGQPQEPTVTVKKDGVTLDPSLYKVTYKNNVNVSDSTWAVVSGVDNANYEWKSDSAKFTITKRTVRVLSPNCTKVYDGTPLVCPDYREMSGDGLVAGDSYVVDVTGTITNVGSVKNSMSIKFNNNNYTGFVALGTLTVTKLETTLTDADVILSETSFEYDKSSHCPTVTIPVNEGALIPDVDYTVTCTDNVEVGTATLVVKAIGDNCSFPDYVTHFTITPAIIRVTDKSIASKEYDGSKKAEVTINGYEGVLSGDVVQLSATATFDDANAAEHKDVTIEYFLSGEDADNYKLESTTETYTEGVITPKTISLVWSEPATFVYDGSAKHMTATVTGTIDDEVVNVITYTGDVDVIEVGDYVTVAAALDNTNYALPAENQIAWTITKITDQPVITLADESYVYDGTSHEPAVTVKVNGVALAASEYEVSYKNTVNAGDTAMVIVSALPGNEHVYAFDTETVYYSIARREISYTSPSDTKVFDGEPLVNETCEPDDASLILAGDVPAIHFTGSQTNVGSSKNTFEVIFEPANYAITYHYGDLVVTPKPIELEETNVVWNETEFEYDGLEHCPTSTITVGDLILRPDEDYAIFCSNNVNVGSDVAQIAIRSTDGGNFEFTDYEVNFSILPRVIRVKDSVVEEKVYDGNTTAVVKVTAIDNFVEGEDVSILATAQFEDANVGTDKNISIQYSLAGAGKDNYLLAYESATFAEGVITPREVELAWSESVFSYNGDKQGVAATATTDLEGVTLQVTAYLNDSALNVGSYTTKALTLDNGNFKLPENDSLVWRITPRVLTSDMFTLKDSSFVYDAHLHKAEFELPADLPLVEYDDYTVNYRSEGALSWSSFPPVNAGDYEVSVTILNPNYQMEESHVWRLAINKSILVPHYNLVDSKVYDRTDAVDITLTSVDGIVDEEDVDVTLTAAFDTSSVDADHIVVRFTMVGEDLANYALENDSVEIPAAIMPKALVVSGTTVADKDYDGTTGAAATIGTITTGVLEPDEVIIADATAHFATAHFGDDIDVYVVYTLGGKDGANYSVKSDTLSANIIRPAALPVWTIADGVYGKVVVGENPLVEMDQTLAGTVAYSVDGEPVDVGALLSAGSHEISAVFNLEGGATLPCGSRTVVVEQKSLTVDHFTMQTEKLYDGTDTLASVVTDSMLTGIVGADKVALESFSAKYDQSSASDNREISVSFVLGGEDMANYVIDPLTTVGVINRRAIVFSSYDSTKIYDGTPLTRDSVTWEGDGFVEGELVAVHANGTITEPGFVMNNITYEWADESLEDNYDITYVRGRLTVTKIPQDAPVITPVHETLLGLADGKMIGLSVEMEMRAESEPSYEMVTDADRLFAPGTYYVRMPASAHYDASDSTVVIILSGLAEFNVVASSANEEAGSVTGSGKYTHHSAVTIEATPLEGYHFVAWNDTILTNPHTFTLSGDTTFVASFAPNHYVLSLLSDGDTLKKMDVAYGDEVTLSQLDLTPTKRGYDFTGWDKSFPLHIGTSDVSVEAQWTKQSYRVNVLAEHATVDEFTNPVLFEESVELTITPNTGYHFVAWQDGVLDNPRTISVVKDTNLTALVEVNQYELKAVDGSLVYKTIPVSYGDVVTTELLDTVPSKMGYDFKGWSPALPLTVGEADVRLVAQWAKKRYMVTFLSENGTIEADFTNPVSYMDMVGFTAVPNEGYRFVAWENGETEEFRSARIVKDTTFTAHFELAQYGLTLMDGDSVMKQLKVTYGEQVTFETLNFVPTKPNYVFDGWSVELPFTMGAGDMVLSAQWRKQIYDVHVIAAHANEPDYTVPVAYMDMVQLKITPDAGYHFVAWKDDVSDNPRNVTVFKDTLLEAILAPNQYELTAMDGRKVLTQIPVNFGETVTQADLDIMPTKKGYDFTGWEPSLPMVMGADNVIIMAQWSKKLYQVTLDTVGVAGTVVTDFDNPVAYQDTIALNAIPGIGHHFVAWNDGVTTPMRSVVVVRDTTLAPIFAKNQIELTAISQGEVVKRMPLLYGDEVTDDLLSLSLAREGYDFVGWNPALPLVAGTEDITLEAIWTLKKIELTIQTDFENGAIVTDYVNPVTYGDSVTFTVVPNEGYHFVAWTDGDATNPRRIEVVKDTTLTPIFEKNDYVLTLVVNGDTVYVTVQYGDVLTEESIPVSPTKRGYDFVGWTPTLPITVGTEPIVLEAQWSIQTFEITMDTTFTHGKVELAHKEIVSYGDTIVMTAVPEEGYHFKGWTDGSRVNPREIVVFGDTAFIPEFALNSYTLTVVNDQDTMNTFTFLYGDTVRHEILDRLTPTKVGHEFIGWDAQLPIFMPAHDTAIHANYIPKVYTIVAKINGNVGQVKGEGDYDYGTIAELTALPNRGYHFVSWGDGDTASNINFKVTGDTIVSALFAKDIDEMMVDTLLIPALGYCPGTQDVMRYTLLTSEAPTEYRIIYDDEAKEAGFEDIDFSPILEDNEIRVIIPDCPARVYKAKVQFRNASNSLTPIFDVDVRVNLSNEYITDIWDDVVSAVNLESRFVEYQWYHNDVKVGGANAPYYCEKQGLTGSYYMEVVTVDGEHLRTCKKWFNNGTNTTLSVYPNPTSGIATVELSVDNGAKHRLVVTNPNGMVVLSTSFEGRKTQVDFGAYASGTYVVEVDGLTVKEIRK